MKIKNYINGNIVAPKSKKYFDNYNPATGQIINKYPDSDYRDIDEAVLAAKQAFNYIASIIYFCTFYQYSATLNLYISGTFVNSNFYNIL